MTSREALHEIVDRLTDREAEELLIRLRSGGLPGTGSAQPLDLGKYPALARIWDNDEDTIFDTLRAG